MKQINHIELIQNTFSTLILDAIQYFPENVKKIHYESSGLLFGIENKDYTECDYLFPVGSVEKRTKNSIMSNPKVELALKSSRQLLSTSKFIGTYHSHPYEEYFKDWARPSNGDLLYSETTKFPFEIIIAITRAGRKNNSLTIEFSEEDGYEFFYNSKSAGNDWPLEQSLGYKTAYISGEFSKYKFEIRAYQYTGNSLKDIDLKSSEAELLSLLKEENLKLKKIESKETHRLRKLEFNLRTPKKDQKRESNIQYHLAKMKTNVLIDKE